MSLRIRLLLYVLCGAMVGFWLNVAVVFLAVGAQEASAAPAGLSELVELAYWPSWVWWRDPGYYFQPNLVSPHVVNIFGWAAVAGAAGLLHHAVGHRGSAGGTDAG